MSKQSSESIKEAISGITERRAGLAAELEKANRTNEKAQTELLATGSDEAMKAATVAHARASALEHAVTTLDETLEKEQQDLQEAETYESQEGMRLRMAELDREMDVSFMKYREGRIKLHKAFEEVVPLTVEAFQQLMAQRREYQNLLKITGSGALLSRLDGVESLQPFGHLIGAALDVHANIVRRGTPAERKAKLAENSRRLQESQKRINEERAARELESRKKNESGWTRVA